MIDRGNGARASKAVSVRVGREALLRKALLGSTALIGIGLVATPAAAQTTIVSPSGGGTIQRTGGSNPTVNNQTGSGGGVLITNVTGSTGLETNGVTIANTNGTPNANALDVEGSTSGLNTTGMVFAGTNNISTTASGGAAFYLQTNANMGITFLSGGSTFTGSYGLNLSAPAGYISLESTGFDQSFVGNGTAVAGINAISGVNAGLQIGGSSITGFATGVNAQNTYGTSFTSTGGTINATGVGLHFIATGGGSTVNSQSAITAPTGILSTDTTGSTITTSGNGTINAVSAGSGTGIAVSSTGSGVTTVNVGAAIGNATAFGTGVSLTTGNPSTATLNVTTTAAITAATYGLYLQAWAPAGRGTIDIGANITAGTAIYNSGGVYDYIIRSGATVTSTAASAPALSSGNSTSTLNNAGTLRATGAGAAGFQGFGIQTITNSGTIDGAAQGISMVNSTTINNTGTIQGGTAGGIQGSIGTVNNTGAGALIIGNTGITSTTNPLTVVNSGTVNGATWGIVSGGSLTSITSSGTISGTTGAIQLNATGTQSVNLQAGSTTTGNITATNNGTRTIAVAGTLAGGYDATGGANTAVDNFTLSAGGSVSGAIALGGGNDSFSYLGGTLGSTVDGGTGTDGFFVNMGSSTNATLDQSNFTNFDSFYLTTGNLTLTGSRSGGAGWTVSGGNATQFTLSGSLTNITGTAVTLTTPDLMFVQSGAQLSATGDVIYSSGNGNNIQNSGTITSGTGASSAIAIGSGTVDNYGTITYAAGGSITTQGNGVLASSDQLSLTNHTGATLIGRWDGARANNGAYVTNDGLIQGDRFAGVEITGTSIVQNNATGRIYGATGEGSGLLINSGAVQVTNAGQIVGAGPAGINNVGSGLLSVSNTGTIGSGTLNGSNNFVAGGAGYGVFSASLALYNSGTISATLGGVRTTSSMTLNNVGTITTTGNGHGAVESGAGTATIRNSGTITAANYSGVLLQAGGTLTNAVGGTITGGNDAYFGAGVFTQGFGTINNYGTLTSGSTGAGIVVNGNSPTSINLYAGSYTGSISAGAGDETVSIYNGQVNGSAVTQSITDPVSGATSSMTLQNTGTINAAVFGAISLGSGNDTVQLRGTGNGVTGQTGTFSLANATGVETITKLDGGIWVLTGAANSAANVNVNGGTLQFQGTSGLGTINANGGIVRADGSGAFGSAVVHLLSSNVQFAASGVYANNFVLDVPAVLNGQPAVFENLFGGNAILSGSITSGSGTNAAGQAIGASQAVTFAGIGGSLFNLTGTGNSWTGITTINSGVTVRGSTSAISGGSITNNGTLTYVQSGASSSGKVISGTGALRLEGGQVTLTGFNTYTGGTAVAGGVLQVGDGTSSGRITGAITVDSGGTLIFNRSDNYDFTSAISGDGNVQALGTVSLSGAITTTGLFTVDSATGGQVTLTGARSGANASGVTLGGSNNVLRVGLSGSVAGGQYVGVRLGGANDRVDNFGAITNTGTGGDNGYGAAIAVTATSGTSIINNGSASNSTATISGQNAGINHVGSGGVVATGLLTVNNYGLIAGNLYNAIENQGGTGALTVTNYASGRIVGQGNAGGGNGIGMGGAGALTLTNSGLVVGRSNGVATSGSASVTNSGTIAAGTLSGGTTGTLTTSGDYGILANGGTITNQTGGRILGFSAGASMLADVVVNNSGVIASAAYNGATDTYGAGSSTGAGLILTSASMANQFGASVFGATGISASGTLSLGNSGTITGTINAGVDLSGANNALYNNATITGGNDAALGYGVYFASTATGSLTNRNGALVSGGTGGVYVGATGTYIDNTGSIVGINTGSSGVNFQGVNAIVTNQGDGSIVGQATGASFASNGNVNNSGFIGSGTLSGGNTGTFTVNANGTAVSLNGGYVSNYAGATITGGLYGITSGGTTAVNISNYGTINATTAAINLTGTADDTVTLGTNSVTNGAILLGAGSDTLNWWGGSFTSIDAGAGNDTFSATIYAPATLDVSTLSGFEAYNLSGGETLTLSGTQAVAGGGWSVNASGLALDATAFLKVSDTTGVSLGNSGGSLTIAGGGKLVVTDGTGVFANTGTSVTNAGLIKSTGGYDGVITNGGTIDNQAGGRIIAAGNGVTLQAYGTTLTNAGVIAGQANGVVGSDDYQTLTNTGVIVAGTAGDNATAYWQTNANLNTGDGVRFTAGGSVTNVGGYVNGNTTGIIVGGANGVTISGGAATIENSGTLQGNSGYGISIDTAGGVTSTITNHNGGALVGGTAAALLTGDGTVNMTNEYGSYMYGSIVSTGNGTRNIDLSGVVYGNYDATSGDGVDNVIFRGGTITDVNLGGGNDSFIQSGGSIANVDLGDGDDVFTYLGGSISGTVNGGAGHDRLNADLGAGSNYNVTLANFMNFEAFGLVSGDMTITGGAGANNAADIYAGNGAPAGTVTFTNTADLTGDIFVNGAKIRTETAGGFGSGTIHMIDPTATFGATGTYANNISLEVVTPSSADPSTLNADDGVIATLTGAITTGTGVGVDPDQDVVIGGLGTIVLTNAANDWTGTTTINFGATLQGDSNSISGSSIVNNGNLVYQQATNGTVAVDITGSGNFTKSGAGDLLLTGANNWTGNTTITGGSLTGTTDSISGNKVILSGGSLVLDQAASGTFATNVSGTGNVFVNGLAAGETLTFSGNATQNGSFVVQDGSAVAFTGTVHTGGAYSVVLSGAGASVTNSGQITGSRGIDATGADATVVNLAGGTITGTAGPAIALALGGSVTNGGTIASGAGFAGVSMAGANGSVTNTGTIQGTTGVQITSATSASVINSGTITGTGIAVRASTAGATIDNSGSIQGTSLGVYLTGANATLTNQASGSITGGVATSGGGVMLVNNGSIAGNNAVVVNGGGAVVNSGTITGGSTGAGVSVEGPATITNQSGGTITGGVAAIFASGTGLVTINLNAGSTTTGTVAAAGTGDRVVNILGTLTGGYDGGDSLDAITLGTGATVTGSLDGGAGNDTLALIGSGSATLGTVLNIESATKSGTGTWTIATPNSIGSWTVADGTLLLTGGDAIANTASVAITGGTLQLAASEAIGNLSGTGTVALGANTLGLTSGTSTFGGTLTGTTGNLLIDGANLTFGGTASYTGVTEVRSGSLTLATGASFDPASTLLVDAAGTLDLANIGMTVSQAKLQGVLNGSGTLSASLIELAGATVNANLAGPVTNSGGISTLNGTASGATVAVSGGTLRLGASDRIADATNLGVAQGATFDLQGYNEKVALAVIAGTLAGTGTLTATEYALSDATVNANLGAGTVYSSGTSTLNGTAAGNVVVEGGTLSLGAADRLADTALVQVDSGATLDLGGASDTVAGLLLNGTLAGTGTLTASEYDLTNATVNANLGAGLVVQLGGTSFLNGTAAGNVSVQAGTLALGAANRIADTATVAVASGATFDIGAYNDTINVLGLNGTLAGTGTLTASQYQLTDATVKANLGAGTLFQVAGTSTLIGTSAANVVVQAGTLQLGGADRIADTAEVQVANGATLNIGGFNETVGLLGLQGTLAGTGTLTASQYQLTGATVNANLGAGNVFNLGGTSTLNGTAAGNVSVQAGTLALGAANRIADTATLDIGAGATFDLGTFNETVGLVGIGGTLAGTGTLTAGQYQLSGATVNANLAAGTLFQVGGISTLNGTSGANSVIVQAGTLRLGANERLANGATVAINTNATFDLAGYTETVGGLSNGAGGGGTLALGAGKLIVSGTGNSGFSGGITGAGTLEKQGIGTLTLAGTFANTGRFDVTAGTLAFSGSTQGGIRVQGGTLIGSGTLAGALTVSSGTFSPGGLATGTFGAVNPIGSFTTGSLVASGGTLLFDFGGTSLNFASDSIKVNGTATLTGGTVQVNALTAAASDYRFNQLYTIVQANALTGTFANGSVFATVASNPNLKWRLRYDLVANAVVLQVQKNMEFNDGVAAGDTNTLAVANALGNSTTGNASDQWASTLNAITSLGTGQRVAAFKSFSGEILADVSTATISANNLFTNLLRERVGDGSDALIGGGFAGSSLADVRTTTTAGNGFASALSGATLPGADNGEAGNGGIWGQVYGGYQKLLGDGAHAGLDTTTAGVAMGVETRMDGFTAGIAGGVAQIDADMDSRYATVSGNQYQLGGYLSYDAGGAFIAASGSWYSSDLNSKRTLVIGTSTSLATGDIHSTGYSVGVSGGFRTELGNGLRLALIGNASKVRDQRDGFTENASGGLGLQMASANRDLFTAGAELRLGAKVKTGAGTAMPWVSMGVRYNSGDRDTVGNVRFSGAPSGTGAFGVTGVRIAPVLGTLGVGIDARASKNVRLGVALEGSAGENTREGRASVRVKIGF